MTEAQIRQQANDERTAKIDSLVTKSWENLDNIDIIDSINSQDLEELTQMIRDGRSMEVGYCLTCIISDHFVQVAVDEVY